MHVPFSRLCLSVVPLALVAALTAGGCGDEITYIGPGGIDVGFADGGIRPDVPGDVPPLPDAGPGVKPELTFAWSVGDDDISCENTTRCSVSLSYNSDRLLEVRYRLGEQDLISQPVNWAVEDDTNGIGQIASSVSYTDTEGVASVLTTPAVALIGTFTVKAWVDSPDVAPLYFDVTVSPKGIVPLTVLAEYPEDGIQNLIQYEVRLFRQEASGGPPDCSDIEALYASQADQQGPATAMNQTSKFTVFPNLETDTPQHYAVLAYSLDEQNKVLAWGCNADEATVVYGQAKTVVIPLIDVPPTYIGTYSVQSYFDFITALPESVQPYIYGILDIFESPVGGLLSLSCTLADSLLGDLCDLVFNDPSDPDINDLTTIGGFAVDVIEGILTGIAQDSIWGDILAGGKDISEMVQNFEIRAEIQFKEQPDEFGHWTPDKTYESWHTVVVKWSVGQNCNPFTDPDCGKQSFSVADIQSELVVGSFEADVAKFWDLTISKHPLNLKYGALLNWIIEKQMLKLLIPSDPGEPVIDSYEEFVQALLAGKDCLDPAFGQTCCAKFAEDLIGQGANVGLSTIESLCGALTTLGADFLRQQLLGLDTSTGDVMQIETGETCTFYDQDNDRVVDGFGTEEAPCKWNVTLELLGATSDFQADFWGTRF